eukprot:TRINITY_DN179_c0_g1_i3.p1 TRINITY_DN179_c0_g1~~TRINITY_DN179_c0_g1_i3.p1  ORF type:complete len:841 (-),score=205.16 TRINITY_DN179_c0_g1_i3:91-2565(-)
MASVIRIKPYYYIHVLDNNANITKVVNGPLTFTRKDHEKVVSGPNAMIIIPPRFYCIVKDPVQTRSNGEVIYDKSGNAKLRHGDTEIRFEQEPFPLYPGESLQGSVIALKVLLADEALRLTCLRDFTEVEATEETEAVKRVAGEEWLWKGPGTYLPRVEVQVNEVIKSTIIKPNYALRLRATKACVDCNGVARTAGEEWIVTKTGAYLPAVDETIVTQIRAHILTEKTALHLRSTRTFTDVFGKERIVGSEWLVTLDLAEAHIPDVYEEVVGTVQLTVLDNRQYTIVLDPVDKSGKPQLGVRQLRKGPSNFFLLPGERLEAGISNVHVLAREEALLLVAKEKYLDGETVRNAGDWWMVFGPCDYIPNVEVEIKEKRVSQPLDENEGIYVRDYSTGKVRSVIGESYMLKANETLWDKELPSETENLLAKVNGPRVKSRVVTYRIPHNSAVQIYDYREKKSRVVFGPELIMLGPDEHFTILTLSGDKPKRPKVITDLKLKLGPDFMTDIVTVETADHARLSLKLSYNWHFDIDRTVEEDYLKMFAVPDFVGDACKAIAARVRGAVAHSTFDEFHKHSARIIRSAVFGVGEDGKIQNVFKFSANNLVVSNIDIQSVEPVDQRTRDSLMKSVQMAIEITTSSQEATARHSAQRASQVARGRLERQKIQDEAEAEKANKNLLQLRAHSAAIESTGQATAEAKARADAAQIEGEASVVQSRLKAESLVITSTAQLEEEKAKQEAEIEHEKLLINLELTRAKEMAAIESKKFKDTVDAIGADTIASIAQAGPEMQAKLLSGLGIKSLMITDGSSPINLFNTASGLIGGSGK